MGDSSDEAMGGLMAFYARQSHLIDSGSHQAWAETFLPNGEFHSPTYPEPAIGREALADISQAFSAAARAAGELPRHVVTNVWVKALGGATATVQAYLMVVATSSDHVRISRIVTLHDELAWMGGRWLVRYRRVDPGGAGRV